MRGARHALLTSLGKRASLYFPTFFRGDCSAAGACLPTFTRGGAYDFSHFAQHARFPSGNEIGKWVSRSGVKVNCFRGKGVEKTLGKYGVSFFVLFLLSPLKCRPRAHPIRLFVFFSTFPVFIFVVQDVQHVQDVQDGELDSIRSSSPKSCTVSGATSCRGRRRLGGI